jgi:fructosamine-3-kinase
LPELAELGTAWLTDLLGSELGAPAEVIRVEQRTRYELYRAHTAAGAVLVKVGPTGLLSREAANLQRAAALLGDLAPALIRFVEPRPDTSVLVMEWLPGKSLEPGRLTAGAWLRLSTGLLRMHGHQSEGAAVCVPLTPDFVTFSVARARYATLPQLRRHLDFEARRVTGLDARSALALFDELAEAFDAQRALFERSRCWVHGDLWPENVLVDGASCWLIDWAGLKYGDYALDLAGLKLILDWVWPAWRAHAAFEALLRLYARAFADHTLLARMRVYLPLVSLIHLVQFGQAGPEDPDNAAGMRACLATARRDQALWSLADSRRRMLFALTHRCPSEYGDYRSMLVRARRVLGRARRALAHRRRGARVTTAEREVPR